MNVSANTFISGTGTLGSTTVSTVGTVNSGSITTINVTDTTTASGDVTYKTDLSAPVLNVIDTSLSLLPDKILENTVKIGPIETRQEQNDSDLSDVSGEIHEILEMNLPTKSYLTDLSNRIFQNETEITDISNTLSSLPTDGEYDDLSGRNQDNIELADDLSSNMGSLAGIVPTSQGDDLSGRVDENIESIADAQSGYDYVFDNISTLVTKDNYNDICSRAIDVSESVDSLKEETDLFDFVDLSSRNADVSLGISSLDTTITDISSKLVPFNSRIVEISNNISVSGSDTFMFGISANAKSTDLGSNNVGFGYSTISGTYFNSKITDIRGTATISDTPSNFIKNTLNVDMSGDISRSVTELTFDFRSTTPYSPTHHIIMDPSESMILISGGSYDRIQTLADGGVNVNLRISRSSKSRRILVTIPPVTANRLSVTLYDDDSFTTVSNGTPLTRNEGGTIDPRTGVMQDNLSEYRNILYGSGITDISFYRYHQNILLSPGTVPAFDVSFANLNTDLKSALLSDMDTKLQYFANTIHTATERYHGGSSYHIVYGVSATEFFNTAGLSNEEAWKLEQYSNMSSGNGIGIAKNNVMTPLPSFYASQTFERSMNGNQAVFYFTGVPRIVYNTTTTVPANISASSDPEDGFAGPFDYYAANSYTFEIDLVSTGREEHSHLAKLYINEKTRQTDLPRFYESRFYNNVPQGDKTILPGGGEPDGTGFDIYVNLVDTKKDRTNPYQKLIPNPSVI